MIFVRLFMLHIPVTVDSSDLAFLSNIVCVDTCVCVLLLVLKRHCDAHIFTCTHNMI